MHCLLAVAFAGLASPGFAATQGEWGRTSTATAKITLRILPHHQKGSVSSVNYLTGDQSTAQAYGAVRAYCNAPSAFNRSAALFTANVLDPTNSDSALDADSLLRANCRGTGVRRTQASTSTQQTVLVSPI